MVPATGLITGIPSLQAPADDQFTVQASDSGTPAETATASLSIQTSVPPPLTLSAALMPPATADAPYSQQLTATGGTAPYTWSIASGGLPAGLTLQPGTGVISGSPKAGGTFSFTAQVSCPAYDATGPATAVATTQLTLIVNVAALKITDGTPLPAARAGLPYSVKLDAAGGTTPFTWSIASGTLPAGLTLHPATGVISGTPAVSGDYDFSARVTDSEAPAQAKNMSETLYVLPPLAVTTTSLPAASVGSPYMAQLSASGGTPPYTWSLADGSQLPAGLSLSPDGSITGVPEAGGSASFAVEATDAQNPPVSFGAIVTMTIGFNIQG